MAALIPSDPTPGTAPRPLNERELRVELREACALADDNFRRMMRAESEVRRLRAALQSARAGFNAVKKAAIGEQMFGLASLLQVYENEIDNAQRSPT